MRRLKRFTELSGSERRMLFRALFVVMAARASLWIMPVGKARKWWPEPQPALRLGPLNKWCGG